jgi:two-component system, sensor histidine kinase YesM
LIKNAKTIQSNLFFTYSLIILTVLILFVSFFYYWMTNLLRDKAFTAIANLSYSTSEKLDIEIKKMDYVSMNILYSNVVKDRFEKYINEPDKKPDSLNPGNQEQTTYII